MSENQQFIEKDGLYVKVYRVCEGYGGVYSKLYNKSPTLKSGVAVPEFSRLRA
jgi:hypothetical protein